MDKSAPGAQDARLTREAPPALGAKVDLAFSLHADESLSRLFSDIHAAITFIARREQLPQRALDEAALAATGVIDKYRRELHLEAARRLAKKKGAL